MGLFNMCLKRSISVIFILFLPFFLASNIHANAFKCVDKTGNIVFQDSACTDDEKQTQIEIQKNIVSVDNIINVQCKDRCDNRRANCVAGLGNDARNTGENLLLCEKAKEVCYLRCAKVDSGGKLDTFVNTERSNYKRELRREQALKNKARYKENKKDRAAKWDQKYNKWNCQKYKKRLAKIKAKWERKQGKGWTPKDEVKFLRKIENAEDAVAIECK